jgi:hypothetical protein
VSLIQGVSLNDLIQAVDLKTKSKSWWELGERVSFLA